MGTTCVVGLGWGDEGKGKIVDILSRDADIVVRFQGGANAGHTVVIGNEKFILHQIPSGILHKNKHCVISNGVVLDLSLLLEEISALRRRGIEVSDSNLMISERAHLVMPYHRSLDEIFEKNAGSLKIGTTLHGIGPCYADKYARKGIRVVDLFNRKYLKDKLEYYLEEKNRIIEKIFGETPILPEKIFDDYTRFGELIRPYVKDTINFLRSSQKSGKNILFEGAHGMMLDIDFGTYPYVTSTACGVPYNTGISPRKIDKIIGVAKAYMTRVGEGPFPTEEIGKIGDMMRRRGAEFGSTTGRPRRCGWFDAVITKYTSMLLGIDEVALTKLDVLSEFDEIKVCTSYNKGGEVISTLLADIDELRRCEPVYQVFPGWKTSLGDIKEYSLLPDKVKKYVEFIEDFIGVKVGLISIGIERGKVITCDKNVKR